MGGRGIQNCRERINSLRVGQFKVEYDQRRQLFLETFDRFFERTGDTDGVSGSGQFESIEHLKGRVIFDEQYMCHGTFLLSRMELSPNEHNLHTLLAICIYPLMTHLKSWLGKGMMNDRQFLPLDATPSVKTLVPSK